MYSWRRFPGVEFELPEFRALHAVAAANDLAREFEAAVGPDWNGNLVPFEPGDGYGRAGTIREGPAVLSPELDPDD